MTASVSPEVIEKQKKLFCDWFTIEYMVSIHFDGDKIVVPLIGARSQGRSVSLCANVAWSAWQEARQSAVIELPNADHFFFDTKLQEKGFVAAIEYVKELLVEGGYRVEVNGD